MIRRRIYVDTSVIGGCCDEEFSGPSNRLFEEFRRGRAIAVISVLTLEELERAPDDVRAVLGRLPQGSVEYTGLDKEAADLADSYIAEGIVGPGSLTDARQIAVATLNKVDVIVSWNYRHIVNLNRIQLFAAANLRQGLTTPEIRTPIEVLEEDEEDI